MEKYIKLSEIESRPIPRMSTSIDELDFIYGYSIFPESTYWGMPQSKISLWAGTSGIGKSRLAIKVAKNLSKLGKVLFIQTESSLEDFAGWAGNTESYPHFYCSGESRLANIIEVMYTVRPSLVFVDSVNEIEEFENGNKRESRLLINGKDDIIGFRQVVNDIGCHLVLLGQLNGDGSIKGGTSLPHLVDIALDLKPYAQECKSTFTVSVGVKHRYGRRDDHIYGVWYHEEDGVKEGSDNRLCDDKWCNSHGLVTMTRGEMLTSGI